MTEETQKKSTGFNFDKSFVTDKQLEVGGAWDEIYMDGQSLEVLVARSTNANYKRMMRSLLLRNKRKIDREDEGSIALFEQMTIKVMAKTILLGWKELTVNGEDFPYSVENAELVLANEDFRKEITAISESFDLYKNKDMEEAKGN